MTTIKLRMQDSDQPDYIDEQSVKLTLIPPALPSIEEKRKSSATRKDPAMRIDLPWTENTERELWSIEKECTEAAMNHEQARRRSKCKYTLFGLPSMLIPLVTGGLGSYIQPDYEWIQSAALIVTAVNSGILQFFNFGEKQNRHNEATGKYSELADAIKMELSKPINFRLSCDVFMERVFVKFQNINATAPPA